MPQLCTDPWFMILVTSWLTFLTIVPTKVLSYTQPNEPTPINVDKHITGPWNWPWQ
uniref:ATP synthase complex subunit 8 n=1 Tax=Esomus metallicus TaxID=353259 RepID=A0ZR69_9TELE|nr:ATP synthase F0 subunit 8 [Esomus metallicus]BAF41549.1 ATPase subunit 8 [Esomus metallicus]